MNETIIKKFKIYLDHKKEHLFDQCKKHRQVRINTHYAHTSINYRKLIIVPVQHFYEDAIYIQHTSRKRVVEWKGKLLDREKSKQLGIQYNRIIRFLIKQFNELVQQTHKVVKSIYNYPGQKHSN